MIHKLKCICSRDNSTTGERAVLLDALRNVTAEAADEMSQVSGFINLTSGDFYAL